MADKSSIIINATDRSDNEKSMSVGYINPLAKPSELISFAQGVNALTENTYRGTTLVEKTDLVNKPDKDIKLESTSVSYAAVKTQATDIRFIKNNGDAYYFYPYDAAPRVIKNTSRLSVNIITGQVGTGDWWTLVQLSGDTDTPTKTDQLKFEIYDAFGNLINSDGTGEIVLEAPETLQYASKTFTITVNA